MKIQNISIKNYKAFYGEYDFDIASKNLLVYGENGSGKSSLYYALKDFFQSSMETINLNAVENIFVQASEQGQIYIKAILDNPKLLQELNSSTVPTDTLVRDANRLKSFLTYKHLLGIHYVKVNEDINLFDLLVNGVLKHYKSESVTGDRELGELWQDVVNICKKPRSRQYNVKNKEEELTIAIKTFNDAFGKLFAPNSPQNILINTRPILDKFFEDKEHDASGNNSIKLKFSYREIVPNTELSGVEHDYVGIDVEYFGQPVLKPHVFLNEAKLSAIAISIYLGMVLRHAQGSPLKVLFLDDIFIGLDMGNRLPLLKILQEDFEDYQIFMTTYDRQWFEIAKKYLGEKDWKAIEMYVGKEGDFDVPVVMDKYEDIEPLGRGEKYFKAHDYFSAGNNIRQAVEKRLEALIPLNRRIGESKLEQLIKKLFKYYDDEKFGHLIDNDVRKKLKLFKDSVMNPASHYDLRSPLYRKEVEEALAVAKSLEQIPKLKYDKLMNVGEFIYCKRPQDNYEAIYLLVEDMYKITANGQIEITDAKNVLFQYTQKGTTETGNNSERLKLSKRCKEIKRNLSLPDLPDWKTFTDKTGKNLSQLAQDLQ